MSTITKQVLAIPAALAASLLLLGACASKADTCQTPEGLTLQILGSGGPVADDARSSTSYVIWADGQSRVLVDFGSGAFLRFGQAGARFEDIDHIAISHFHTDHSADLVALLKTGYFSDRRRDLSISGPSGSGLFPGLDRFLDRLVGKDGAYAYLSGYMDGSGGLPLLRPVTLDATARKAMPVFGDDESPLQIEAIGVPHSIVPALAYRIRIDDKIIVFSGDQNGNDDAFTRFARNADVLVMHMPVPEGVRGGGRQLHAPPSRIGQIAGQTTARTLVISHFMARSLQDIDANIDIIRGHFDGEIIRASDLQCIDINSHGK
jgi:ribonuclease BN (tRNA processing enzyme)